MLLQIFSISDELGQNPASLISGVKANIFGFVARSAPYIQSSESPDAGYKDALILGIIPRPLCSVIISEMAT